MLNPALSYPTEMKNYQFFWGKSLHFYFQPLNDTIKKKKLKKKTPVKTPKEKGLKSACLTWILARL